MRRSFLCIAAAACGAVLASSGLASRGLFRQGEELAALEPLVLEELKASNTPGAALAAVLGDQVVYAKGFGVASIETGVAVTPDTLFQIGSMTKTFTAAALVSLAKDGKVSLDRPVSDYVTGLSPKLAKVTAAALLSHTAGLKDEPDEWGPHDESALAGYIKSWTDDYCLFDPGQVFSYSNSGMALAGLVLQEAGGKPYADQITERLLAPLGMVRSTFRPTVAMTYPLAVGHRAGPDKQLAVVRPMADDARLWPAGTMYSSVNELAKFAIALLNEGRFEGKQVIAPSVVADMSMPHAEVPILPDDTHYGYGLFMNRQRGTRWVWHDGSMPGFAASLQMLPDQRAAVITLANSDFGRFRRSIDAAIDLVAGPLVPRMPPPARTARPMTDAEMNGYVGSYTNPKRWTSDIVVNEGSLYLKQFGNELKLVKIGDGRFEFFPPGQTTSQQEIGLVPASGGRPAYLQQYVWAFRKVDGSR